MRRILVAAIILGLAGCTEDTMEAADLSAPAPDLGAGEDLSAPAPDLRQGADLSTLGCLPVSEEDLAALIGALPLAPSSGTPRMAVYDTSSPQWRAAHDAALAWAAADCPAFAAAARGMGYRAREIRDRVTGHHHWVLTDESASYNGVFVFRAPAERAAALPLVIDAPHLGFDFRDTRAVLAYRDVPGVALLQNTAHRCNANVCSGCSRISNYACTDCEGMADGPRVSDVVHSVNQLYYAVYDGLEEARDDLHFEYHGAGSQAQATGCSGTAHISQASSIKLDAAVDDGTFPNRFWRALQARIGEGCVCYHQRQTGCQLNGGGSTPGRRTNEEAAGPVNECTQAPGKLAGRFLHFEQYRVDVQDVIPALRAALGR
jgi:hypothetical protein